MTETNKILRIDTSMRHTGSVTRALTDKLVARLRAASPGSEVTVRDLAAGVPLVNEAWIGANFTDPAERDDAQRAALAHSDELVAELKAADTLVIGLPIYNFGVPAAFKAWVDMIARARETFRYTETGPEGLMTGKRALVVVASGGVPVGSAADFATPYVRHVLGFIGITEVEFISADSLMSGADAAIANAEARIGRRGWGWGWCPRGGDVSRT
ncbi:MAG: NAD(P)H-dependent oxidoreductase [Limibaculum sp.]